MIRGQRSLRRWRNRFAFRVARWIAAAGCGAAILLLGDAARAEEILRQLSPDGRFALRQGGKLELIALPSRKALLELPWREDFPSRFEWAPDARRFAIYHQEGTRVGETQIYARAGESFEEVELPELPEVKWPERKGWVGRRASEFVQPVRWLSATALLLERECSQLLHKREGGDEDSWGMQQEITIAFGKSGRPAISRVKTAQPADAEDDVPKSPVHGPSVQPGLPDAFALGFDNYGPAFHSPNGKYVLLTPDPDVIAGQARKVFLAQARPFRIVGVLEGEAPRRDTDETRLEAQWSADSSVALVTRLASDDGSAAVELIELREGRVARITHLQDVLEELLLPDFRRSGAEPHEDGRPLVLTPGWVLEGNGRVVIACEATTNPDGNAEQKSWLARLTAVWSIAEAKFTAHKVVDFCWTTAP